MSTEPATVTPASKVRAFTPKALLFALVGVGLMAAGSQFNNERLQQTLLIGNHMPPAPVFLVLLLGIVWNPLFGLLSRHLPVGRLLFSTREMVVVLSLMLMVSWIPGAGLSRYGFRSLVMPWLQVDGKPDWKKYDTMGHLPQAAFPLGGSAEALALAPVLRQERIALEAGTLASELTAASADPADYRAALDLIEMAPAKQWRAEPLSAWRSVDLALIRLVPHDQARAKTDRALLERLPGKTFEPAAGAPAAWTLAWNRVGTGFSANLPEANREFERVFTGYKQGLPVGNETISITQVPWSAWGKTLMAWGPIVLCFALATIALSLVLHRQWSHHEQLGYPIATVMSLALERSEGSLVNDIFRNRLFWFGFVPVLLLQLFRVTESWFPGRIPVLNLHWGNWSVLYALFPDVGNANCATVLGWGSIFFSIIGLAYFIGAEISLSLGLCNIVLFLMMYQFYKATGEQMDDGSSRIGAFIGYALILLYTGRHYYWAVLSKAFGLYGGAQGDHLEPVWAARLFLAAIGAFVLLLVTGLQLDWFIALLYAGTLMLGFTVFSRIVCETGIPLFGGGLQPAQVLTNLLGVSAVGAAPLVLTHYLGAIFSHDQRENMQPYVGNSLKLAENAGFSRFKLAGFGFGAIAIALVVAFVAYTWGIYQWGATADQYACNAALSHLDEATSSLAYLHDTGQYATSVQTEGLAKLGLIAENTGKGKQLGWMAFGAMAVIAVSLARFRFSWWPIHPVLFCVSNAYGMSQFWLSFLIGWAVKCLVVKFAGGKAYQSLKPIFIGLILGEIVATGLQILVGLAYYWSSGLLPKTLPIFPA